MSEEKKQPQYRHSIRSEALYERFINTLPKDDNKAEDIKNNLISLLEEMASLQLGGEPMNTKRFFNYERVINDAISQLKSDSLKLETSPLNIAKKSLLEKLCIQANPEHFLQQQKTTKLINNFFGEVEEQINAWVEEARHNKKELYLRQIDAINLLQLCSEWDPKKPFSYPNDTHKDRYKEHELYPQLVTYLPYLYAKHEFETELNKTDVEATNNLGKELIKNTDNFINTNSSSPISLAEKRQEMTTFLQSATQLLRDKKTNDNYQTIHTTHTANISTERQQITIEFLLFLFNTGIFAGAGAGLSIAFPPAMASIIPIFGFLMLCNFVAAAATGFKLATHAWTAEAKLTKSMGTFKENVVPTPKPQKEEVKPALTGIWCCWFPMNIFEDKKQEDANEQTSRIKLSNTKTEATN